MKTASISNQIPGSHGNSLYMFLDHFINFRNFSGAGLNTKFKKKINDNHVKQTFMQKTQVSGMWTHKPMDQLSALAPFNSHGALWRKNNGKSGSQEPLS